MSSYDVAIIGGGPSGLAATIHGTFEGLKTITFAKDAGQMVHTGTIQNIPGFLAISGVDLHAQMEAQARALGADIRNETVYNVSKLNDGSFQVTTSAGLYTSKRVVVAVGKAFRHLPIYDHKVSGVSYGGNPSENYSGRNVAIIGGSNAACQSAIDAAKTASQVYILDKHDSLLETSSVQLVAELNDHRNIMVIDGANITDVDVNDGRVYGLNYTRALQSEFLYADVVLVCIGQMPDTQFMQAQYSAIMQHGLIVTSDDTLETSISGLYAIGDCRLDACNRMTCAMGDGSRVIAEIVKNIND